MSTAKLLVIAAIVGATAFGLFLGYLAYTSDSFPPQERPFGDYANVTSSAFNGTEFAFWVQWNNARYIPQFAQLTSTATDAANTPVCDLKLSSVTSGQSIFMPFTISPATATLSNVDLSIAVQSATNSTQFTITYNIPTVSAPTSNTLITPSNVTCEEAPGPE